MILNIPCERPSEEYAWDITTSGLGKQNGGMIAELCWLLFET